MAPVEMTQTRGIIECESMDMIFYDREFWLVNDAKEIDDIAAYLNFIRETHMWVWE